MKCNIKKLLGSQTLENISISFCIHIIALLILSLFTISVEKKQQSLVIDLLPVDSEIIQENKIEEIENFSEDITVIKPQSVANNSIPQIETEISIPQIDTNFSDIKNTQQPLIDNEILTKDIVLGLGDNIDQQQNVGGVLDRLTIEIINHAENKDLNVIWLFDASVSLTAQRSDIKNRIVKIFNELSHREVGGKQIYHTVGSFGKDYKSVTKIPTQAIKSFVDSIDSISIDESGIENIFNAIDSLCQQYKSYHNMVIVFTDEVGDDIDCLEKCISTTKKYQIPVYVVGPPAPFGLPKILFKYVDPDPKFDQKERWVEIKQGPETLFKMTLDIESLPVDQSGLDSGFGPYALTRLCYNSGGIYFSIHPNRTDDIVLKKNIQPLSSNITKFFDIEVMKKYSPDYRHILTQQKEIDNNKIKWALVNACQIPIRIVYDQKMSFTAFNESEFVEQLNDAQNFAARLEPKIERIYVLLKSVENLAENLDDKRWLASYHLAMGRILATKCRIELYNIILAEAKSGLKKKNPKTNCWTLSFDENVNSNNSQINKIFDSAQKHLDYVVVNFPDTPWSYIASEELRTPMGYKWTEEYKEPTKSSTGNNNNNPPKDDMKKKLEFKPQRKIDQI